MQTDVESDRGRGGGGGGGFEMLRGGAEEEWQEEPRGVRFVRAQAGTRGGRRVVGRARRG